MKTHIALALLITLLANTAAAQTTTPPPPLDATQIVQQLLVLQSRIESLSQQLKEAHAEDLKKDADLSAQVMDVHEILVVEANKPSWIGELLTNRTFWESVGGLVASVLVYLERK